MAGSALHDLINDQARIRGKLPEVHVADGVVMQPEFSRVLHDLRFAGRAVRVHEHRILGGRISERGQIAGLQCVQSRAFLRHDLFLEPLGVKRASQ